MGSPRYPWKTLAAPSKQAAISDVDLYRIKEDLKTKIPNAVTSISLLSNLTRKTPIWTVSPQETELTDKTITITLQASTAGMTVCIAV
jgi:hypothetical protein